MRATVLMAVGWTPCDAPMGLIGSHHLLEDEARANSVRWTGREEVSTMRSD